MFQGHPCQACYSPWTPPCSCLSPDQLDCLLSGQAVISSYWGLKRLQLHSQQLYAAIREELAAFLPGIPDRRRSELLVSQEDALLLLLLSEYSHCSLIGESSCHPLCEILWCHAFTVAGLKVRDLSFRPHYLASESHRPDLRGAGAPTLATRSNSTRQLSCCFRISQRIVCQRVHGGTLPICQLVKSAMDRTSCV